MDYEETAYELVNRIRRLMAEHQEIKRLDEPWQLCKLGLQCVDLQPTAFQVGWALRRAQQLGPMEVLSHEQ